VVGLIDQTDNFFTIVNALELDRDLDSLSADATVSAPEEVQPGAELTVTADCFFGDRQVTVAVNGEPVEAGTVDVVNGTASYTLTAPAEEGSVAVSFTGVQSGVVASADVVVTGDAAADDDDDSDKGAAAIFAGAGSSGGPLALTGTAGMSALLIALVFAAIGGVLATRRQRRSGAIEASTPQS
jgi:alkaline phosphatase